MTTDEDSHDDETDLGELDLFLPLGQCDCYYVIVIEPTLNNQPGESPGQADTLTALQPEISE